MQDKWFFIIFFFFFDNNQNSDSNFKNIFVMQTTEHDQKISYD